MSFVLAVTIRSKFAERLVTIQPMSNCALFMHLCTGGKVSVSLALLDYISLLLAVTISHYQQLAGKSGLR